MYVQNVDLANRKISFSPSLCPGTGSLALLIVWQTFFASIWTTYKWTALPAVHSHSHMSPVAVPRFANVCGTICGIISQGSCSEIKWHNYFWARYFLLLINCVTAHMLELAQGLEQATGVGGRLPKPSSRLCPQFFSGSGNSYLS